MDRFKKGDPGFMSTAHKLPRDQGGIPIDCLPGGAFGQSATDTDLICLHQGWSCLSTSANGWMPREPLAGFSAYGTRFVTGYQCRVNGQAPKTTLSTQIGPTEWTGLFAVRPRIKSRKGKSPGPANVGLRILRRLDGDWLETLRLEGYGSVSRPITLEIQWSSPVDDVELLRAARPSKHGLKANKGIVPSFGRSKGSPMLVYRREFGLRRHAPTEELEGFLGAAAPRNGTRIVRELRVTLTRSGSPSRITVIAGRVSRIRLSAQLSRGQGITLSIRFSPRMDKDPSPPPPSLPLSMVPRVGAPSRGETEIRCGNPALDLVLRQTGADLHGLELGLAGPERQGRESGKVLLGGIPRFVGIFTRDALIASHHASLYSSAYLKEALGRIAAYQGVRKDSWRDEEPGRLHHERRLDPESAAGHRNRELYYGDALGTPYWNHALAEAFRWSGDRTILRRHEKTLRGCTSWLRGKLAEGQGLLYYQTHSSQGNRQQGWKDSDDAIVDGRGRLLDPPLATVELQGYAYLALREAAWILDLLGDREEALSLRGDARRLKERFEQMFWDPRLGFYALAVTPSGRRADAVTSNPAHCLATGLMAPRRAAQVARRLGKDDLFSGWGIRTLSSKNPSYDPFSYHRGSVWPVDNAFAARNLRRIGARSLAGRIVGAELAAALCFPRLRLPETMSGHARSFVDPAPGLYPESNLIQAWSVTALISFTQTLLGLRPRSDQGLLFVDPDLPRWIPWIELRQLHVGDSVLDLRFWRDDSGRSRWKIVDRRGNLRVQERDWSQDRPWRIQNC